MLIYVILAPGTDTDTARRTAIPTDPLLTPNDLSKGRASLLVVGLGKSAAVKLIGESLRPAINGANEA